MPRTGTSALFRSAARAFGAAVIGVALSGARDDGTAGMASIVRCGRVGLARNPSEAQHGSMPQNVLEHVRPCQSLPVAELGQPIAELIEKLDRVTAGSDGASPGAP